MILKNLVNGNSTDNKNDNNKSLKNIGEKGLVHSKNNNREIRTGFDTDKIIEELFESFLQNYQEGLENSMKAASLCLTL